METTEEFVARCKDFSIEEKMFEAKKRYNTQIDDINALSEGLFYRDGEGNVIPVSKLPRL